MNLSDHIAAQGGTAKADCPIIARIATDAGCSPGTLYMIARGHKLPGWKLCERIEQATAGGVTRQDLRPDIFGQAPAAKAA